MAVRRDFLCYLITTVRADSFLASRLRTCRFLRYYPVRIIVFFLRDGTNRSLIDCIAHRTVNRFRTFFATGCFLIHCIIACPFMTCGSNSLRIHIAAVRACSFFTSCFCAGSPFRYIPLPIGMLFLRNCNDTCLINSIAYRAMDRLRTFLCTGRFFVDYIPFIPLMFELRNRFCDLVSASGTDLFLGACLCAGCFLCHRPAAIAMFFFGNSADCILIYFITHRAVD